MKIRFTFKSSYYSIVAGCGGAALLLLPVIAAVLLDSTVLGITVLIITLILHLVSLNLAACVPCSIVAEEEILRINVCWKKSEFFYKDIESASVTNEFVETLMLREVPYYIEKLTLQTKSGEFSCRSKSRAMIQEDGRPYPLEDGKLEQVRRYIAPRIQGGRQ